LAFGRTRAQYTPATPAQHKFREISVRRHINRVFPALWMLCASATFPVMAADTAPAVPATQREQIESVIRDYLERNPEVVQKALVTIQQREAEAQQKHQREAIASHTQELYQEKSSPVGGNPKGTITLVEFFDYTCPHCKHSEPAVKSALEQEGTNGSLRIVYKELPILGPGSLYAARAALAADKQGKYHALHAALMDSPVIDEPTVQDLAKQVGLDVPKLLKDMEAPEIAQALDANSRLAAELDIQGTPAFILGGQLLPGGLDGGILTALIGIEKARAAAPAPAKTASSDAH
jgi:protein-disulfide isomerase